jgi:hypothetical protein
MEKPRGSTFSDQLVVQDSEPVIMMAVCENYCNTSQQDFVPQKVNYVSNVTFHAKSKYAIKIFPSPTVFVQWHFLLLIFQNFSYILQ